MKKKKKKKKEADAAFLLSRYNRRCAPSEQVRES